MRCETVQTTLATGPSWERGYDLLPGGEKLKARRGTSDIGRQGNGIRSRARTIRYDRGIDNGD
jgi:hypothetical protein